MKRLAFALLPLLLFACKDKNGTSISPAVATPAATTPGPTAPPPRPHYRQPECLNDEHGLPLMAQITRAGVTAGGKELPLFAPFYYVFARDPAQGVVKRYELGTTRWRDSIVGHCPADAVALWSTVVGACPTGRVNVYGTLDQLEQLLRTGTTQDPIAVSAASSQRRPFLWPIVETRAIVVDGVEHAAWRIHFLGRAASEKATSPSAGARAGAARYTTAEIADFQQEIRQLDIVWVIDATGSMEPFWKAARELVRGMTKRLAAGRDGRTPKVRFGLVAFRDHGTISEFVTQVTPFTDEGTFLTALEAIPIDHGGDLAEAGLDALDAALDLAWRPSKLASRIAVLVSDASFHEGDGPQNPSKLSRDAIVARAREQSVHVFGMAVGQQKQTDDRQAQALQYRDLAERTGGAALAIEQADSAVQRIEEIVAGAAAGIDRRASVLDALAKGARDAAEVSARTALPAEQVTECLEFLAGGLDLSRLAPGEAAFATGWVLPVFKNVRQLDMRVLLARGDCELLRDACRRLIADLADKPDLGDVLVRLGVGGRSALGALVVDERADIASYLAARHQLVFRKDSVLRLTRVQIAHMSEQDRRHRLDGVALALKRLLEFERDDRSWFHVNATDYGFAAEEVLP